jgi:hypothetical protein
MNPDDKRLIIAGVSISILALLIFVFLRPKKTNRYEGSDEVSEELTGSLITPVPTSVYYSNSTSISAPTSILSPSPTTTPTISLTITPMITNTPISTPTPTVILTSNSTSSMYPEKISLSLSRLVLDKNQTEQAYVKYEPEYIINKKITWSVDDGNILSVTADGLVTALNTGTVTISVASENGLTDKVVAQVLSSQKIDENSQVLVPDVWDGGDVPNEFKDMVVPTEFMFTGYSD